MKKLLLVLPTLLLLAAPVSALANGDHNDNHGSKVSVIAKDNQGNHGEEVSEVARDNHGNPGVSNQGHKENEQDEDHDDENDNEEKLEGKEHRSVATVAARENSNQQLKIKISIKGNNHLGSPVSATHSATPSASIKISGPLDQVIQMLSKVLDFLRSLV